MYVYNLYNTIYMKLFRLHIGKREKGFDCEPHQIFCNFFLKKIEIAILPKVFANFRVQFKFTKKLSGTNGRKKKNGKGGDGRNINPSINHRNSTEQHKISLSVVIV